MYENIIYEKMDNIGVIKLNRPKALNALSVDLKNEMIKAFNEAGADDEVRVIILTGAGDRAFCAGQDLNEAKLMSQGDAGKWIKGFDEVYLAIRNQDKPTIAVINGFATGAGLQIAILCDIKIAAEGVKMGMTEINIGLPLITGSGFCWELVNPTKTKELALLGSLLDAEEAKRIGMVNMVLPQENFFESALAVAKEIAGKPPVAVKIMKKWWRILEEDLYTKTIDAAKVFQTEAYESGEPQKYMTAFFEERDRRKREKS